MGGAGTGIYQIYQALTHVWNFERREANIETNDDHCPHGIVVAAAAEPGWMIDYPRWPPAFLVTQNEVPTPMCTPEKPKPGLLRL
jgi:hypothetical protein